MNFDKLRGVEVERCVCILSEVKLVYKPVLEVVPVAEILEGQVESDPFKLLVGAV